MKRLDSLEKENTTAYSARDFKNIGYRIKEGLTGIKEKAKSSERLRKTLRFKPLKWIVNPSGTSAFAHGGAYPRELDVKLWLEKEEQEAVKRWVEEHKSELDEIFINGNADYTLYTPANDVFYKRIHEETGIGRTLIAHYLHMFYHSPRLQGKDN
jgi:hypothetical protein